MVSFHVAVFEEAIGDHHPAGKCWNRYGHRGAMMNSCPEQTNSGKNLLFVVNEVQTVKGLRYQIDCNVIRHKDVTWHMLRACGGGVVLDPTSPCQKDAPRLGKQRKVRIRVADQRSDKNMSDVFRLAAQNGQGFLRAL